MSQMQINQQLKRVIVAITTEESRGCFRFTSGAVYGGAGEAGCLWGWLRSRGIFGPASLPVGCGLAYRVLSNSAGGCAGAWVENAEERWAEARAGWVKTEGLEDGVSAPATAGETNGLGGLREAVEL